MIDLTMLELQRAQMQRAMLAPNTEDAYGYGWQKFEAWCGEAGVPALPCSTEHVRLYAVHIINQGLTTATLAVHLNAISSRHRREGMKTPVDPTVRQLVTAIRRLLKQAPQPKAALTLEQLRKLMAALDSKPLGRRNRAMFLLGFASGMRRSELAALNLSDIEFVPQGLKVRLRYSKTDQEGKGRDIGVFPGSTPETCPIAALVGWLAIRGSTPGPLFPRLTGGGTLTRAKLSGEGISRTLKKAVGRIGFDPAKYGGHSLRAGFVTAAYEAGASEIAIMRVTGHTNVDMVRRYVRPSTVFAVNPLKDAL